MRDYCRGGAQESTVAVVSLRPQYNQSLCKSIGPLLLDWSHGWSPCHHVMLHGGPTLPPADDLPTQGYAHLQIQGKSRELVAEAGRKLGLDGTYIARSYIEQIQLAKLTASFQNVTADLRRRFVVDGEPLLDEHSLGASPRIESHRLNSGFSPSKHRSSLSSPPLSTSGELPSSYASSSEAVLRD